VPRSGCGWRVEANHELDEYVLEAGLVVVGVLLDERDHLSVAVGCLLVVATGLIDHAEAIVAIVHVGEPHQEIARGALGLVELACKIARNNGSDSLLMKSAGALC